MLTPVYVCKLRQDLYGHNFTLCRINNAGSNAYKYKLLAEHAETDLIDIVSTNVLGVMLCCREVCLFAHQCNVLQCARAQFGEAVFELCRHDHVSRMGQAMQCCMCTYVTGRHAVLS